MAEGKDPEPRRRHESRRRIDNMLTERQQVLVTLCKVSGRPPYGSGEQREDLLPEFCQLLTDYIALAHFVLYERISEGQERRQLVLSVAREIYPEIAEITDAAMNFSERFAGGSNGVGDGALQRELSALGEHLASRIELEDRLINAVLK